MIAFKHFLLVPFLLLTGFNDRGFIKTDSNTYGKAVYKIQSFDRQKQTAFGVSINLYRVGKAEKFEELKDMEKQIAKTQDTKVDLYKMTSDLAMIFLNSTDPFKNEDTIPYKMLFGRPIDKSVGLSVGEVGGFLPSAEIARITKWIKDNKVETFAGFSKMYDGLSLDVKKQLEDYGSEDKVFMFNAYVRPLVVLYFTALENQNSVIFVGC